MPGSTASTPRGRGMSSPSLRHILMLALTIIVVIWQAIVVHRYSQHWPSSLWTGKSFFVDLTPSCRRIFFVMHWTVLLTAFVLIAEVFMLFVEVTRLMNCCAPCMWCCRVIDFAGGVAKVCFAIWGIAEILHLNVSSAETNCSDLYDCAWWTYLGILLVSLGICICFHCCCGLFLAVERKLFGEKQPSENTPLRSGP
mmetsp:Transcript_95205/g.193695  ORF Transcript_95205/g.193695 Transcript_95205/m.193695 type:complete len:197 (-) Transcript_95205:113-703(-)